MSVPLRMPNLRPTTDPLFLRLSPLWQLFILGVLIFVAETISMVVVYFVEIPNYLLETLLDGFIMMVLISPALYWLQMRPIKKHIEEREQADHALRENEKLLRNVLELLPVGVWITDGQGNILHGNQASLDIWGGARYVGIEQYGEYKAWWLDSGKPVEPNEWGVVRAIRRGETILNEEVEIECFDGAHKIIYNSAKPIYDEHQVISGAVIVNQDITTLKHVQRELEEREALFRTAFENMPVGVWLTDGTGKITYGNPAGQAIWAGARYVGKEGFGEYKGWWLETGKLIEPEEWAVARAIDKGETSLNEEIEIECFDGTHKIILNSAIPVRDEQGHILWAFVINQDITERKRVEAEIQRYQEHLEELVDQRTNEIEAIFIALQDGVIVYDNNMNVIHANPAFSTTYGFDPIGMNVRQIIDTVSCCWLDGRPFRFEDQPTPRAINGELVRGAQYSITCPDGTKMAVDTTSAPLRVKEQVNGSVTVWHNITELKRAEDRLAYLASFPEQNPNPVTELDLEWNVRYANAAALRTLPDLRELLLAHPWLAGMDVLARIFAGGLINEMARIVTVGDRTFHQSINYTAPEGFIRIYGVDITERKRAEEALQASEARLHVTLNSIGDGVIATDADKKVTFINPVAASMSGWDPEKALGQPITSVFRVIDDKNGLPADNIIERAIENRAAVMLANDTVLIANDGRFVPIEDSAAPILDETGRVTGIVVVFHDVTEKRRSQNALLETSKRLNLAQEIAHLGSWELNLENYCLTWSDEVYRIFGLRPQEFSATYEAFLEAVHPDDREAVDAAYSGSLQEGKDSYEIEHRVIKKPNGDIRIVHEKCEHIRDETGQIIRSIGMVHDVTDRKRAEEELRAARDKLELRVRERTQALAIMNEGLENEIAQRKNAEMMLEQQNEALRTLSQAEREQRELAEGLVRSAIALNTSLELEKVLASILEQIRRAVPFQGADIMLLDGNSFRVASYSGFEGYPNSRQAMDKDYPLDEYPIFSQISSSQRPVMIEDTQLYSDWRVAPGMEWVRSYATAPLVAGGKVIGLINLTSEQPGFFNQRTVEQVLAFVPSAAVALRNAQLYKAELTARQTAETLSAAAQSLTQTLDLDQVLHTLMGFVTDIIPSDMSGVGLLEGEERLALRVANGYPQWTGPDYIFPIPMNNENENLLNQLITTRKTMQIIDTQVEPLMVGDPVVDKIRNWLLVPISIHEKAIGLVGLGKHEPGFFTQAHIRWVEALVSQAAVAIQNAWLFEQVRASSERLQSLARKLVDIQEKERFYIARELHDEAGQALSSLKIGLGRLEQNPDCPPIMRDRLQDLKQLADGVMEDLHRLAMDLRPVSLDQLGLVTALEHHARSFSSETLTVEFKSVGFEGERISPAVETALYRIAQEALTNVVRHSHAHTVGILLERRKDRVILFVEDDGMGFDPESNGNWNLGLVGMRERAELLGGTLAIESIAGKGTTIKVEVPNAG